MLFDISCVVQDMSKNTIQLRFGKSARCVISHRVFIIFLSFLQGGLDDSRILSGDTSKISQLNNWLLPHLRNSLKSYWALCWRANVHGWSSRTFHSNCDGRGPTVTIIKVGSYIFGGYTDKSWRCMNDFYLKDNFVSKRLE